MSNDARAAAEERLLDAELAIVFGRQPHARQSPRSRWLAAAFLLLGAAVVFGTWLLQRQAQQQAQDPEPAPLPEAVYTKYLGDLDDLAEDVQNLFCRLEVPSDLRRLAPFRKLRRLAFSALDINLKLGGTKLLGSSRAWNQPPDDALAPLGELPALEVLQLPPQLVLRPAMLAPLHTAPALRELVLAGDRQPLTDAVVRELAALPHLRRLVLAAMPVDAASLRRLATLPLDSLRLEHCPGLDADAFAAISELRSLQQLQFTGFGPDPLDTPWSPTAAAMARLQALPRLRELRCQGCNLGDDLLRALPEQLEVLQLSPCSGFSAEGLMALRRLGRLRQLTFCERSGYVIGPARHSVDPTDAANAIAAALGTLRLTSLEYSGTTTPELMHAIAIQPDLTQLTLSQLWESFAPPAPDFDQLAAAPALAALRLVQVRPCSTDDLRPLSRCRTLRALELYECGDFSAEAVRATLPAITVQVVQVPTARK